MPSYNIDSGGGASYASLAAAEIDMDGDSPIDSTVANTFNINEGADFNAGNLTFNHTGVGGGTLTITTAAAHRAYAQAAWPDDQGPGDMVTALTQGGYAGTFTDAMGETFILDNTVFISSSDVLNDATGSDFTIQHCWIEGTGTTRCVFANAASTWTIHDSIARNVSGVAIGTNHASVVLTAKNTLAYSLAGTPWWRSTGTTFDVDHCIGWPGDQTKSPFLGGAGITGDYNISTKSSGTDGPNDISAAWLTATGYTVGQIRTHNSEDYLCWVAHTSAGGDEPGVGATWETKWLQLTNVDSAALFVDPNDGELNLHPTENRLWTDDIRFGFGAEGNNLDAWTTDIGGGFITVVTTTPPFGTYQMQLDKDASSTERYMIWSGAAAAHTNTVYWSFFVEYVSGDYSMTSGDAYQSYILYDTDGTTAAARVTVTYVSATTISLQVRDFGSSSSGASYTIDIGTKYWIKLVRSVHVTTGVTELYVDGTLRSTSSAGDNTSINNQGIRLGSVVSADAGTSGKILFGQIQYSETDHAEPDLAAPYGDTAAKLVGLNGTGSTDYENRARVADEWNIGPFQIIGAASPINLSAGVVEGVGELNDPSLSLGGVGLSAGVVEGKGELIDPSMGLGGVGIAAGVVEGVGEIVAPTLVLNLFLTAGLVEGVGEIIAPSGLSLGAVAIPATVVEALGELLPPSLSAGPVAIPAGVLEALGELLAPSLSLQGATHYRIVLSVTDAAPLLEVTDADPVLEVLTMEES